LKTSPDELYEALRKRAKQNRKSIADRTFYDSLYIAVAVQQQTHLVTADEKLANAMAAYLPVKWIGSLSY
jgi:predicted nucleic acid-binding protein